MLWGASIVSTFGPEQIGPLQKEKVENMEASQYIRSYECMLSLPIGCMKFLCSKSVCHHFWPGLIHPLETRGTYLFITMVVNLDIIHRGYCSFF